MRTFLPGISQVALLVLLASCSAPGERSSQAVEPTSYDLGGGVVVEEIAPGVWVHISRNEAGIPANGLILPLPEGLFLVDLCWSDTQAESLMIWAERKWNLPWYSAVITHGHIDRVGGFAAVYRRNLEVSGFDLSSSSYLARTGRELNILGSAKNSVFHGGSNFEVYYPGPGHTIDNTVVWLEQAKILFGGCLVKSEGASTMGNIEEADLNSWSKSIESVRAKYPEALLIVPGHGPLGGYGAFDNTLFLLNEYLAKGG